MARGLRLSPHSRPTSTLLFNSLYGSHSLKWASSKTARRAISQPKVAPLLRFSCISATLHNLIDMPKYNATFAKRMAMAGLKPHHRIALGVSGGPDSMALCVLAANWKTSAVENNGVIDGLLAVIVDHGLRTESRDEAFLVARRVSEMGIRCEIAQCEWLDGKPKQGHLQEAARDMRYQKLQEICVENGIRVLLVAHHADDQAELFILRLSRNSGVLGLAGMAFSSQLFSSSLPQFGQSYVNRDILLVRPLLDLSKDDMYKICQGGGRDWVEDPTNQSQLYTRNRIRKSLGNSSVMFDHELQAVIHACRDTRMYVDQICQDLINNTVTVMPHGYAVIDLELLNPSMVVHICLSKFLALVLQFVSQRQRPVRGSASKLLLAYVRTSPCKTSLTAAGCYLCAAPGSKGAKMLVCCSVNHSLPLKLESVCEHSYEHMKPKGADELEKIVSDVKLSSSHSALDAADVRFLNVPSDRILLEAQRLNILSEATVNSILLLQKHETDNFKCKPESASDVELKQEGEPGSPFDPEQVLSGKVYYFMKRFLVRFERSKLISSDPKHECPCASWGHDMAIYLRHMIDGDWLHLAKLSKCCGGEESELQVGSGSLDAADKSTEMANLRYARLSARSALIRLKKIPVAARRGLPVLIDSQERLLAVPSIGFSQCPCLSAHAEFKPRVPLGGGHSSYVY
uniref:tRNA(Ile)-lysidine synthetase n=1 Tax=Kalanchoe fedtschenkoi TaxID=63787 RepID=A0A7N0ZTH2_KALFE